MTASNVVERCPTELNIDGLTCITNNKLAQEVIAWVGFNGASTPRRLLAHLMFLGLPAPQWLTDELRELEINEVVPMPIQCKLVYLAITAPAMA